MMTPLSQSDQAACDQAKTILMSRQGLSEPEAHRRLQVESQRRRIKKPDLARQIIEAEKLLYPDQ